MTLPEQQQAAGVIVRHPAPVTACSRTRVHGVCRPSRFMERSRPSRRHCPPRRRRWQRLKQQVRLGRTDMLHLHPHIQTFTVIRQVKPAHTAQSACRNPTVHLCYQPDAATTGLACARQPQSCSSVSVLLSPRPQVLRRRLVCAAPCQTSRPAGAQQIGARWSDSRHLQGGGTISITCASCTNSSSRTVLVAQGADTDAA